MSLNNSLEPLGSAQYESIRSNESGYRGRLASMVSLLIYAIMFYLSYRHYISVEWGYTGLLFRDLFFGEILVFFLLIAVQGWLMPQFIVTPGSIILWALTVFVFVPSILITPMIGERDPSTYYAALLSMTFIMFIASFFAKAQLSIEDNPPPSVRFFGGFFVIFVISTVVLFYKYKDIMSFSSIDDVYFQRFAASDASGGGLIGYIRTYYLYVFSPLLFSSIFIEKRYWPLSIFGFGGFILTYYIDASKISLIIPIIILAFNVILKFGHKRIWLLNAGMAFLTAASTLLAIFYPAYKLIADLILFRSIAIPGQKFAQYADVFDARGYTWWSHVRGISSVVAPPVNFTNDPDWPSLGLIVGAEFHGAASRTNLNANLFAGEGIAAAGSIGVLIVGVAMILYIQAFDAAARGWNRNLVAFISLPLALALTNTHLSTLLLSFGGIFWLVALNFIGPEIGRKSAS